MQKPNRSLFVIGVVALFALLLVASTTAAPDRQADSKAAAPAPQPAAQIETASDAALDKLSPDLKRLAKDRDGAREVTVTVLLSADAPVAPVRALMEQSAVSRPVGAVRWVTGVIGSGRLVKLAAVEGLIGVVSTDTFQPEIAPGLEELRQLPVMPKAADVREALLNGGKAAAGELLATARPEPAIERSMPVNDGESVGSVKTADIHNVAAAHAKGYTGDGVVVAVVDSGVDFGNPDLQGTQARNSGGPYDGWPYAYDTLSGYYYAAGELTIGPDNWANYFGATLYVHTLPVEEANCSGATCSGSLIVDYGSLSGWPWDPVELTFTWPNKSKSGKYFYSIHPDYYLTNAAYAELLNLGYGADFVPPALILSDEGASGKYDTVYVDLDFDQNLVEEMAMRRGSELAGTDLFKANGSPGTDGVWDLSASMLTWIADGVNPPPGVGSLYEEVAVPKAGRMLVFVGDGESHGTNVAGMIAGQSQITDPNWIGPINPTYAGAAAVGGAGGPVAAGMAPDARIAAVQNGWSLPIEAWVTAMIGFDGAPESGDEAQLINNSWGYSDVNEDGWDFVSRFGQYLNFTVAPTSTLFAATGNGGAGYGTTAQPNGSAIIGVGASTSFGSLTYFEWVKPEQFTSGAIISWSNRGPGAQESVDPELVCVGAFGTGVNPLNVSLREDLGGNLFVNGESAYDAFGGTSMASPVCTGVGALVYDAYETATGNWPTFGETRQLLMAGATDLGYDGLAQGAGNANAGRSADIAAGDAVSVSPPQWMVGDYRGDEYPAYANIALPGESYELTLNVNNPTNAATNVTLSDTTLSEVHEVTFDVTLPPTDWDNFVGTPTYLRDITALIGQYDPDMVIAQIMFPLADFDPEGFYSPAMYADGFFYDWKDVNGDGNLWTDDDGDGMVGPDEIDIDGDNFAEYIRINQSQPASNNHQVSLGRDALSRTHDGVFFGLIGPWKDTKQTVRISLRFYKKADWGWLTLNPATVSVPANASRTVTATVNVPASARPGLYQGSIEYLGRIIPVVAQVAAEGDNFEFGATTVDEPRGLQPYDNGHVYGMVDWGWRPETGDWRFFFYDIPDGTSEPGEMLLVDTRWATAKTDVDTHIFAAAPDDFTDELPEVFGPAGMGPAGASTSTWIGGGTWLFDTATGGPREVVAGQMSDGLGFIALHNVLSGGERFGDAVVGQAYSVNVSPSPAKVTATRVPGSSPLQAKAEVSMTFESSRALPDGLEALAFGLGRTRTYTNQLVFQDDPNDLCTASNVRALGIAEGGGSMVATTTSDMPMDIDLFLFQDDGDGAFDCNADIFLGGSASPTADEAISARYLPGGGYWLLVQGWNVPGGEGRFDMTVMTIDGQDLTIQDLPTGPVAAGTPVTFKVVIRTNYVPGEHEAVLFVGPEGAPLAVRVPVMVTIPPAADAFRDWLPVARR